MMKNILVLMIAASAICQGQALRDINYNYLYNPAEKFALDLKPVRMGAEWLVLFSFAVKDSADAISNYQLQWETRNALSDKTGTRLTSGIEITTSEKSRMTGRIKLPIGDAPTILAAQVIDGTGRRAWYFYRWLQPNYSVNSYLLNGRAPLLHPYERTGSELRIADTLSTWIVSYYNDRFPAGAPGFSEAQGSVAKSMKEDSVFTASGNKTIVLDRKGMYLFQKDTLSTQGFSIRSEDDYPRYAKVQNLAGPLIYICTKQEYDRLELANGDKKTFDRVILGITNDAERARALIRNYFRRVELANHYFSSYKEGWKTDRGMVYIIFGLPDEVYRFADREVWEYKNASFKIKFDFARSSSVFDPDNYVLIRDKDYQRTWYEVVDSWRNARF